MHAAQKAVMAPDKNITDNFTARKTGIFLFASLSTELLGSLNSEKGGLTLQHAKLNRERGCICFCLQNGDMFFCFNTKGTAANDKTGLVPHLAHMWANLFLWSKWFSWVLDCTIILPGCTSKKKKKKKHLGLLTFYRKPAVPSAVFKRRPTSPQLVVAALATTLKRNIDLH